MGSCFSSNKEAQQNKNKGPKQNKENLNSDIESIKSIKRSEKDDFQYVPMDTAMPVPFSFDAVLPFPEVFGEGRYRINGPKLGEGSFGQVYIVEDLKNTGGKRIIVKTESIKTEAPQLAHEYRMYKALESDNSTGFPKAYYYGPNSSFNMLVMDRLGTNLEDLLQQYNYKFSLKTTFLLADQMIQRLQYLHEHNFIHRDLKPENWCIGFSGAEKSKIYLIDFGLSKKYQNNQTGERRPYKQHYKDLIGNEMFAPLRAFDGIEQSPRDDLESLGYCFFYFRSALPWMFRLITTDYNTSASFKEIREQKKNIPFDRYCKEDVLPKVFVTFMKDIKKMKFAERPDYDKLRQKFHSVAKKMNIKYDDKFEWC